MSSYYSISDEHLFPMFCDISKEKEKKNIYEQSFSNLLIIKLIRFIDKIYTDGKFEN